ncbi:BON domain-containing protein [Roseiterribacter gracilis]|uniref:BON domain-containing protein n=1 Tax=Roseiterribacter gracilis TaxID=2812848 RepID=A0A8S8XFI7_9PROT|nr:BON domain-containing protein [Rhodospirillales bacterium TMPK1]
MRLLPALALVSIFALPGCVAPLVMGAAGTGAVVASQERGAGTAVDDQVIRTKINKLWLDYDSEMYSHLWLSVQEGRVLVAGKLENPEKRLAAVRLAWQVDGVKEVANEIQLGERPGFGTYLKDSWILTQIRSSLTFEPEVSSMNISLECVDGIVYVMGVVRDQQELKDIISIARGIDGVKRVVSFVRVKDSSAKPAATTQQAPIEQPIAPPTNRGVERTPLP